MAIDIANAAEYSEVIKQINFWYGNDAQKVINIANEYGLTPEQLTQDWLTGWQGTYTVNGEVMSYNSYGISGINYATAAEQAANSNAGSVTQTALKTPIETTIDSQTGNVVASSGLTSVATGAKSALTFVSTEVLPAISAAGLGIALGKTIDSALYNLNPDFWDNAGMSSLNPETWNSITQDYPDGFLKRAFNTVFGLNPETGETQQYLDVDAAVYLAQYMQEAGVFSQGGGEITGFEEGESADISPLTFPIHTGGQVTITESGKQFPSIRYTALTPRCTAYRNTRGLCTVIAASEQQNAPAILVENFNPNTGEKTSQSTSTTSSRTSKYNKACYFTYNGASGEAVGNFQQLDTWYNPTAEYVAWTLMYGTYAEQPAITGIGTQPNATTPDFSGCETASDYLNALQTQFPDLFNNAVTQSIVNPDGTTSTKTYLPIGTSSHNNNDNKTQPVTTTNNSGNTQNNTSANPNTVDLTGLENLIKQLTETLNKDGNPTDPQNPDPTGTGNTPPIVTPTGSASALWSVYNPSQAQLNSFGAWLWSSNFIDQILKLFNNPMQSIIGVHKIFATPATSGAGSITVGYLDSGVSANIVSNQYTDIDCGTVKVGEQFGNVFDYTDTHIRLYLPFIGIVDLDTDDVMRGSVKVVYHVDVITGACLADVKVSRDGAGGVLYQFAGDAAVRYPISSGSYIGVVSGIASAIGGVASAVMTGGATLPLAAGAIAGGIGSAKTNVQHSGNFSGNAGAMGAKKPYIIIERPQTMISDDFSNYQGKGANVRRTVAQMSGYFKFSDVHTESISKAAESEIETIRAALESGVIA